MNEPRILPLSENIWTLDYPFRLAGCSLGRRTTLIRLRDNRVIIHTTSPFADGDVEAIHALGKPACLLDATLFHDTFSAVGRRAFPDLPYAVPDNNASWASGAQNLHEIAPDWDGELEVREIGGMPSVREHLFFHKPSRTLILCDLLFNIHPPVNLWTRCLMHWVNGAFGRPAVSRFYRCWIKDREAFAKSMSGVLRDWDFDRIVIGHGAVIESGGKQALEQALRSRIGLPSGSMH